MIKRALLLLLLTAVWAFGSWWYYTCMIKGFCRANGVFTSAAERATTTALPAAVATGALATADSEADIKADAPDPAITAPVTTTTDFIDADQDAISDETERSLGTNPAKDDSDGDGIKDNIELGADLKSPIDTDSDGIIDALDEDDDNDGIPTSLEMKLNSNPINPDSDGDGIADSKELGESGMPLDTDSDGVIDLIDSSNDTPNNTEQNAAPADDTATAEVPVSDEAASDDEVTMTASPADVSDADTAAGITIQKSRLYFPFHSANPRLSDAATNYFKEVVQWLSVNPTHSVVLTGHTDDVGKAKNNLDLGLKRAIEIKDMMITLGASATQIDVASMGETQPIATNKTESGRRQNRRVELVPLIK